MIKKSIKILAYIYLGIFVSCDTEDFLEESPRDRLTADNLYTTPAGFENGLNALYAAVRLERTPNVGEQMKTVFSQISTDAYYTGRWAAADNGFVEWGSFMSPVQRQLAPVWDWLYQTINAANTIIGRAENSAVEWDSDVQKNQVIAEARAIRAWAYRHLIYTWGPVPLTLTESSGENIRTDWTREPVETVAEQMIEDWLFAEEHLPAVHSAAGRLNKAVARHYLAETYLLLDENQNAKDKALAVTESAEFSLITERYGVSQGEPGVPFMDQFHDGNVLRSQGNTEVLWEMPFDRDLIGGGENFMRRVWLTRYDATPGVSVSPVFGRGSEFLSVTKYAWDLYEPQDDRYSRFAVHRFFIKDDGDTLFTTTEGLQEPTRNPTWPATRKWDDGDPTNPGRNEGYDDQPYLRLAETYLLLAEAQLRLNQPEEAVESINILRRRSNAEEIEIGDVTLEFILEERIRELLTEEHRRYTLNRLGLWYERTKMYNNQSGPFIAEFNRLYPLPQHVIDANLALELPQNPGYE